MQTDVDALSERLRTLADQLASTDRDDVREVTTLLYDAADAVDAKDPERPAPTVTLCAKREHGETCDRAARHDGACSFELRRLRRIAREYDAAVREVREARHAANLAESRAHHLQLQVKQLSKRTSWLARLLRRG